MAIGVNVARLIELAEINGEHTGGLAGEYMRALLSLHQRVKELEAREQELSAIAAYADHAEGCSTELFDIPRVCDCGFEALADALQASADQRANQGGEDGGKSAGYELVQMPDGSLDLRPKRANLLKDETP
jgi:hypothetical protein